MLLSAGSLIAGKFRLERPLAQGGMGSVWVAFNTQLEVPIALKFMAPALVESAELVARFEREAKAAAQLRNPHVVQIFEHGVDQGTPFIAMELLEGEDLGSRLRAKGRLSFQETSRILGDVCKALRRAHDMGLVHRDLKPANIFLSNHEEYEVIKVLDFGIAKSLAPTAQDQATKSNSLVGSPHYMSPEQARRTNKQVDHRTDLWAMGVIAFRCITGHLPYPGEDVIDVLVRVCTDAAPVPSAIASDLGPEVDRFFARALAREPEDRFQSAKEMAEALAALAGHSARESSVSFELSSSDLKVPLLRMPEPGAEADAFDNAKTLPLNHPGAQRAVEGKPWAAAVKPGVTPPLVDPPPPIESAAFAGAVAVPPASGTSVTTWKLPAEAPRAPMGSGPDLGSSTAKLPPSPPSGYHAIAPASFRTDGTLTSAGAEVELRGSAASREAAASRKERPWVALAAAGAAVVVIGVIGGAVVLARGAGDASGDGAPNAAASGIVSGNGMASASPLAAVASASVPTTASPVPPVASASVTATAAAPPIATADASGSAAKAASSAKPPAAAAPATSKPKGAGTVQPRFIGQKAQF